MKLTEHPDPPSTLLIIAATNIREQETLENFAKIKHPLTATLEHDRHYPYPHLIIKKEKS